MTSWVRFEREGTVGFGTLSEGTIAVHRGDMFEAPEATGESVSLDSVTLLTPCLPTKMIGLWNNLRAAAEKQGWSAPEEPLYFFKPPSCFLAPGGNIAKPASFPGRVFYEGELGVVIGKRCRDVTADEVASVVFGYTCVNDVTAFELIQQDPSFPQWCRGKSFDTFGPFGPAIVTGVDPSGLQVKTELQGRVRQDYPVSDMFFSPSELVQRISRDMTLEPGDVIACGTGSGALPMKPGSTVAIVIDGIGTLTNTFAAE